MKKVKFLFMAFVAVAMTLASCSTEDPKPKPPVVDELEEQPEILVFQVVVAVGQRQDAATLLPIIRKHCRPGTYFPPHRLIPVSTMPQCYYQ